MKPDLAQLPEECENHQEIGGGGRGEGSWGAVYAPTHVFMRYERREVEILEGGVGDFKTTCFSTEGKNKTY